MDNLFYVSSLILLSVSAFFALYRQFQMLQQNSYFPSRYFKWVKGQFAPMLAVSCIMFCLLSFINNKKSFVFGFALVLIWLAVWIVDSIKTHKKSIKPLVFTGRVKRLYGAALLLLSGFNAGFFAFKGSLTGGICAMLILMLSCVSPLLCFAAWAITLPIEKAFNRHYINDAKKILKANPNLKVIGITGSYGKTTTKFILNRILSEKYNTVCTPKSFNTPLGVVRTIRESVKPSTQVFICEMGAKNIGDIKEICDIVNPKFGIITSVGAQHLETFKSVDNVFKTKFELRDAVIKNGGICLANIESEGINSRKNLLDGATEFGNGSDYYVQNIKSGVFGTSFDMVLGGEKISCATKLLGLHSLNDILAAATLAKILGVESRDIAFAVGMLKATEHRLELKSFVNGSLVIDDAYNSNPEGCLEAVRVLGSFDGFKKTIITPGLVELGEKEYECNYNLGLAAAKYADTIILVGKNRSKPLVDAIEKNDFNKDNLYIAGSFKDGLAIYSKTADKNSVLLIENDLPDNYLN